MHSHFTVAYRNGVREAAEWLRHRALDDPLLALGEDPHDDFYVVVAAAKSQATWVQEQIDAGCSLAAGVCLVEVSPQFNTMRVNLECGEDECAVAARLIKELLNRFPDYVIYDDDKTEVVRINADELFT